MTPHPVESLCLIGIGHKGIQLDFRFSAWWPRLRDGFKAADAFAQPTSFPSDGIWLRLANNSPRLMAAGAFFRYIARLVLARIKAGGPDDIISRRVLEIVEGLRPVGG
jgi:hypothetical protein